MGSQLISTRQQKAIDAFIAGGIKAVWESGVDRISVSQVTELAKATRPTFYSYFGDVDGLLAEIWLVFGQQWLRELGSLDHSMSDLTKSDRERWTCLAEILSIAHRVPAIYEVVEPTVQKWWAETKTISDLANLKSLWLVAGRLGTLITLPVDKEVSKALFSEKLISLVPETSTSKFDSLTLNKLPGIASPKISGLSVTDQLIQAAIEVIANAGVAAASMTRISRKAKLSTGSAYPRFSNADEIINTSFDVAVGKVVDENFSHISDGTFGPEEFGLFVVAGLMQPRTTWRNFRVEIHIEARVNKELAKRMQKSLRQTNARVAKGLEKYNARQLTEEAVPYFMHAVGIGFAILLNANLDVDKIDHRKITVEFVKLFSQLSI